MDEKHNKHIIVIGASSGGVDALKVLLPFFPGSYSHSIVIVQHMDPNYESSLYQLMDKICKLKVIEAEDKMKIEEGVVYYAPSNYHLLIEANGQLALTTDNPINYSRPSIDVLFESAADSFSDRVAAVLLTGANEDGAEGLKKIQDAGGIVIVQDPETAHAATMPAAGLRLTQTKHVLSLEEIGIFLTDLEKNP